MKYSVAISTEIYKQASAHLLRTDRQEDLTFALWCPSRGNSRFSALIRELILPKDGERVVRGNVSFLPHYFDRAIGLARANKCGLALLHSHLGPGWQDVSEDDITAERTHAPRAKGATGFPLVGLTLGTDGAWSARLWEKIAPHDYKMRWCESVRVVGDGLLVTYEEKQRPVPKFREELTRTVSAWGTKAQADLARIKIGIIGTGSVGSIVAESIARMGICEILLMDFDGVEYVNLDRLLFATREDARKKLAKVKVLAKALKKSATAMNFSINAMEYSVVEEIGFRHALDCDILFSCVDRPWARAALNHIAYSHLIPVIDGGLKLEPKANGQGLKRGFWKAHVAAPSHRCLECLGQYDASYVGLERAGLLDDPRYIESLEKTHELRTNENVFGFSVSVASFEILQFLRMVIPTPGHRNSGAQTYNFVAGDLDTNRSTCDPKCLFNEKIALGDLSGISFTGIHAIAESARKSRQGGFFRWLTKFSRVCSK